ncbi:protein of unknown function [Serratia sp. Tan611]|nr:protein of unknown function [Serratia sp. Tan611]
MQLDVTFSYFYYGLLDHIRTASLVVCRVLQENESEFISAISIFFGVSYWLMEYLQQYI